MKRKATDGNDCYEPQYGQPEGEAAGVSDMIPEIQPTLLTVRLRPPEEVDVDGMSGYDDWRQTMFMSGMPDQELRFE